jgi:hypothetical protein
MGQITDRLGSEDSQDDPDHSPAARYAAIVDAPPCRSVPKM